ncbi:MAG: hypothetical protein ABGW50_01625 [Thermococcus sp.]
MIKQLADLSSTISNLIPRYTPLGFGIDITCFGALTTNYDEDILKLIFGSKRTAPSIIPSDISDALVSVADSMDTALSYLPGYVSSGEYVFAEHFNGMAKSVSAVAELLLSKLPSTASTSYMYNVILGIGKTQEDLQQFYYETDVNVLMNKALEIANEIINETIENVTNLILKIAGYRARLILPAVTQAIYRLGQGLITMAMVAAVNAATVNKYLGSLNALPCLNVVRGAVCAFLKGSPFSIECFRPWMLVSSGRVYLTDRDKLSELVELGKIHVKSGDIVDANEWDKVLDSLKVLCPTGECISVVPACYMFTGAHIGDNEKVTKSEKELIQAAELLGKESIFTAINVNPNELKLVNPELYQLFELGWKNINIGEINYTKDVLLEYLKKALTTNILLVTDSKLKCYNACADCYYNYETNEICGDYCLPTRTTKCWPIGQVTLASFPIYSSQMVYATSYDQFASTLGTLIYGACVWLRYGIINVPPVITLEIKKILDEAKITCYNSYTKNILSTIGEHDLYVIVTYGALSGETGTFKSSYPVFIIACDKTYGTCLNCEIYRFPSPYGIAVTSFVPPTMTMDVTTLKETACLVGLSWFMYKDQEGVLLSNLFLGDPLSNMQDLGQFGLCVENDRIDVYCMKQLPRNLSF